MAQVSVFKGGNIQLNMPTQDRQRAADFGPSPLAVGLEAAGKGLGQFAEQQDKLEDIQATAEANEHAIAFANGARAIKQKISTRQGGDAKGAADAGGAEIDALGAEIMGKASSRAQMKLRSEIAAKSGMYKDSFFEHEAGETNKYIDASSIAKVDSILEESSDEPDEAKAVTNLGSARQTLQYQADHFGRGNEWVDGKMREVTSTFFKSRALKLTIGDNGSAAKAIEYATAHRKFLNDDDYNAIVNGYDERAMDERIAGDYSGTPVESATTTSVKDPSGVPTQRLDPDAFFNAFTVPHEGAAYVVDSNGAGVKYGINAAYNPGVDVKNLTQTAAAKIFRKKYFEKSGADKLPPALAAAHVDTFYLNEREAGRILRESGGDVDKYLQLRDSFLNGLVAKNPAKYGKYQKGWHNRTAELAKFADRQGGSVPTVGAHVIGADTDLTATIAGIEARKDVGRRYKDKAIAYVKGQRSDAKQEVAVRESAATDALQTAANGLGDGFTDIKQLPSNAWLQASPQAQAQFINQARGNKENHPADPTDLTYINFTAQNNPRKFMSKTFTDELRARGVPTSVIRNVAERQGTMSGTYASPADAPSSSALWTLAQPAFLAAGLNLTTLEEGKDKKGQERQADAIRRDRAVNYLSDLGQRWAQQHHKGEQPDDQVMRSWIGIALSNASRPGQAASYAFEASDEKFYTAIPEAKRRAYTNALVAVHGPGWLKRPVNERIADVVQMAHDRDARGKPSL